MNWTMNEPAGDGDRLVMLDDLCLVSLPLRRESLEFDRCLDRFRDD